MYFRTGIKCLPTVDETKYKKREGTVVKVKISNPNQTVNIDKTKQTKKRTAMVQNEKKTPNHKRFDIGKTLSSKGGGVLSISLCSISPPISHIFTSRIHSALEIKSITRPI